MSPPIATPLAEVFSDAHVAGKNHLLDRPFGRWRCYHEKHPLALLSGELSAKLTERCCILFERLTVIHHLSGPAGPPPLEGEAGAFTMKTSTLYYRSKNYV